MDEYSICSDMEGYVPACKSKTSDSASNFSICSNPETVSIEPPINSVAELGFKPQSSPMSSVASSRRKSDYFDPQSWIESDCEDFFSVSGDATPSYGKTPVNHSSFIETPELDKPHYMDSTASSIPQTEVKKQLIELFHESFRSAAVDSNQNLRGRSKANPTIFHRPTKSLDKSRYECVPNSACSIETTPNRSYNHGKRKLSKSAWCCLPNLGGSLSFVRGRRG